LRISKLYIELSARRHLGNVLFGRGRSEEAYTEVRPQVEKGLRALKQLPNFGPYVPGREFGNADVFVYHALHWKATSLSAINSVPDQISKGF